jgi:hypothetical protein
MTTTILTLKVKHRLVGVQPKRRPSQTFSDRSRRPTMTVLEMGALLALAPLLGIVIGFIADELFRMWVND